VSFLLRYIATDAAGECVHDETVVANVAALEAIEKDVWVLGQKITLRVEFDPPLAPAEMPPREEVSAPIGTGA
jgi:hypothetical protein